MSRTIHSYAIRILAMAGFLGMASLVAPAATHAQTISPERALLNTTAVVSYSGVTVTAGPSRTVDGESALLGRSNVGVMSQPKRAVGALGEYGPVDGVRALLNKVALSGTRRRTVVRSSRQLSTSWSGRLVCPKNRVSAAV